MALADSVFRLPVLIESQQGYRNLCRLLTTMKMRTPVLESPPRTPARWGGKGEGALTLDDLDGATVGLIALGGRAMLQRRASASAG